MSKNKSKQRWQFKEQGRAPSPTDAPPLATEAAPKVNMSQPAPEKQYIFRTNFSRQDHVSNFLKSVFAYLFQPIILAVMITVSYIIGREIKFLEIKARPLTAEEAAIRQQAQARLLQRQAEIAALQAKVAKEQAARASAEASKPIVEGEVVTPKEPIPQEIALPTPPESTPAN